MMGVILVLLLLLTGCSSVEDKLYKTLETAVSIEKEFDKHQKSLTALEVKEKELFDKMLTLGMKEFEQITKLADEALENLNQREELVKKEQDVMAKSRKEVTKAKNYIDKINDDRVKEKALQVYEITDERFESHAQLVTAYEQLTIEDRKIYELMKEKELELEQLTEQIDRANEALENVKAASDEFNKQTETFNEMKIQLYKEAGIKVKEK